MKKTIAFVVLGAILLGAPMSVFGETSMPPTVSLNTVTDTIPRESSIADLGVEGIGTLPTSKFYFLKEWKRGLSKLLTFSEVKKSALILRITNEKLAEVLAVEEANPFDPVAFRKALENYSKAESIFEARMLRLKSNSDDTKTNDLPINYYAQSEIRAGILGQVAERWRDDPYAEDAAENSASVEMVTERKAIALVLKDTQRTIVNSWAAVVERQSDAEEKAETQLTRAESEFNLLKVEVAKLEADISRETNAFAIKEQGIRMAPLHSGLESGVYAGTDIAIREQGVRKAEISTDEPGVQTVDKSRESDASAGKGGASEKQATGPIRIDSTPARLSTNMTIERQTPKRDFGDRMKAGLETAGGMLAQGRTAFAEKKFGEAFGHARSAEMLTVSLRRAISEFAIKEQGVKSVNPLHENNGTEVVNPIHELKDQQVKVCHPSATETCDNGTGSERPAPSPISTEPKVVPKPAQPVACTEEARLCPDGSSVGRTGPKCEFSDCPAPKPTGMTCTGEYDPVCGADGKTYSNSCTASSAGISVVSKGECGVHVETGSVRSSESR